jgi:hypothetical protein
MNWQQSSSIKILIPFKVLNQELIGVSNASALMGSQSMDYSKDQHVQTKQWMKENLVLIRINARAYALQEKLVVRGGNAPVLMLSSDASLKFTMGRPLRPVTIEEL